MNRIKCIRETPSTKLVELLRNKMSFTQTEMGEMMGTGMRAWQKREASERIFNQKNVCSLAFGEYNFILLIAELHPFYRLTEPFNAKKIIKEAAGAEDTRQLRKSLNLKQAEIAELMGYTLSSWKAKEQSSKPGIRRLRIWEYNFLLLLAGEHSKMRIEEAPGKDLTQFNSKTLKPAEYHLMLLIANLHPYYRLEEPFDMQNMVSEVPMKENADTLRNSLALEHKKMAELLGYTLLEWIIKITENASVSDIQLKPGEYNFLLLLAGKHPNMKMIKTAQEEIF
ncbi:hypothetical protein [Xenorhabdus bovienii]|uniref:hypothetical protein n=1 Tax=Xenorhabdus bovienii TaxID=40576 RepID=UPI003DA6A673